MRPIRLIIGLFFLYEPWAYGQLNHRPHDQLIINYVGDLSIEVQNTNKTEFDSCIKGIKWYYNVTVKNTNGNGPFTFEVAFMLNGKAVFFHRSDNNNISANLKVVGLYVNESRTYNGYILTGLLVPNPEVKSTLLTGVIEEVPLSETKPFAFKITGDVNLKNNKAEISRNIPYFTFHTSAVERLPLVDFPQRQPICGYAYNTWAIQTSFSRNDVVLQSARMWLWMNWFPEQGDLITCDIGQIQLSAVQAGCFPASDKHYFYIKSASFEDKYLIPGDLGIGYCKMVDAKPENELLRRWVFTSAPVASGGYSKYNIYNVALGPMYALHCSSSGDDDYHANDNNLFATYLFLKKLDSPNQLKQRNYIFANTPGCLDTNCQ